jgi:predicted dehydrogenase
LSLDFGSGEVRLINKKNEIDANGMPAIETESWNLEKSDALLSETKSFVNSILNNTPCVVTGEDGVEALKLAEQIIYAIEHK